PVLQRVSTDHWKVLEKGPYDFHELKSFLESCIDFQGRDDRNDLAITKDKRSLKQLLEDLRALANASADRQPVAKKRYETRLRIIHRLDVMIAQESHITGSLRVRRIPWRVLPPGTHPFVHIMQHYQGIQRHNPHVTYDLERLRKTHTL